jgi:hypothetical protein
MRLCLPPPRGERGLIHEWGRARRCVIGEVR